MPATHIATTSGRSAAAGAAACRTVNDGSSRYGYCPAPQPHSTAATASPDDSASVAPNSRFSATSDTDLRNANADPRRMTPNAASVSGTYSVDITAANARGKPVHNVTSTKMSQTWLASHTGPIECSI